jgi:hypothetical protein
MCHYKQLYFAVLPFPMIISSAFGVACGMEHGFNNNKNKNQLHSFSGMVGYTSLGMITGLLYPISFPMLAGYTLLQREKQE